MPKGVKGSKGKGKATKRPDALANTGPSPSTDEVIEVDLGEMSIDDFKLWSPLALKNYLFLRNEPNDDPFDQLAARAYFVWEKNIPVNLTQEQALRANLDDYKKKLRIGPPYESTLPDPFTLDDEQWLGEAECAKWPSLYFSDISDYLRMKTPSELLHRLTNEYKQGKAYRYFTCNLVEEIHYHKISDPSDVCLLACKVRPSMRSLPPYQVWAAVAKDTATSTGGTIYSAYCTCTAGLHGSCNHIAGLLFRVENAVRTGMTKPTCTSQPCVWNVPTKKFDPAKPIILTEQKWKRDHYFNQVGNDFQDSVYKRSNLFSPLTKTQEEYVTSGTVGSDMASVLRKVAPNSCFVRTWDARPFPAPSTPDLPLSLIDLSKELVKQNPDAVVNDILASSKITTQQQSAIAKATESQALSSDWHSQRKGRITASNFHRVYTRMNTLLKTPESDTTSLVKSIMGYDALPVTAALKHGRSMEPHAKLTYAKISRKSHKKFTTKDSGLVINKEEPYMAASPDVIVSCDCHGEGLCEIKCPYSIRDQVPSSANWKHLQQSGESNDGDSMLSITSQYYSQIQAQLAILQLNYCDLFVYTAHGSHLERILFNATYWKELSSKISLFWNLYVAPELLSGDIYMTIHANSHLSDHIYSRSAIQGSDMNQQPDVGTTPPRITHKRGPLTKPVMPSVYLCGICSQEILSEPPTTDEESVGCDVCKRWFHFVCVGINDDNIPSNSADDKWFCEECDNI